MFHGCGVHGGGAWPCAACERGEREARGGETIIGRARGASVAATRSPESESGPTPVSLSRRRRVNYYKYTI